MENRSDKTEVENELALVYIHSRKRIYQEVENEGPNSSFRGM